MKISELSIDKQVIELLTKEGLDELYPPQQHAIEAGVLDGKNLVLASPTASGKTLVAELCMMQHVLEHRGKALYLAPLRALASEKFKEFQRYSTIKKSNGEYIRVGISTGDYDSSDPWLGRYDIIISTNEKGDSLLRHRAPWMGELTLVVADEIHLLTEQERGPTLEVVLTRLNEINPNIQVLALSATVRNADEVASWLKAGSVTTDWRPVPLREGIYHDNQVQFRDGASREILSGTKTPSLDIALDILGTGGQALIFTETRRSAVEMGRRASVAVKSRLSKPEERALRTISDRILSTGEKTRLSEALATQVEAGAGFHHAGLAGTHRGIIEDAFREGRIKVLAATPTLCLPAGEEIFGNPAPVAIEKLSSGDRVLTHGNVFEDVVAPTSRWYDGILVKVTPWLQLPMRMTPEHKVLRVIRTRRSSHTRSTTRHWWTYSKSEWAAAKNLQVGDLVLFPRIKEEHDLQYLDLSEQGALSNQYGVVGKHWSRLKIDRLELTCQTLEVLGLYLAEGYSGTQGQVLFALNTKEAELTSMVTDWFKAIGLRPTVIDSERHRRVVGACSKQLAKTLRALCGRRANEKRIPHQLMYLPNSLLTAVVRGMWQGDGNITRSKARTARYATVSGVLAKQLFAVLVKLGYMPAISISKKAGITSKYGLAITHKHALYTVSVSGKQLTRFLVDVLKVKSDMFGGNREFNRGYLDSNFYYMPIRKVEREPYKGTVHNLEVKGHSSYVGSFVVHNSAGVNLPARVVVISSYERYEAGYGRYPISVLEYRQFCGRAGRPRYDKFGEALLIARNPDEAEWLMENYVLAQPEKLWSKLAAERILRPHVLSTIAAGYAHSEEGLYGFFARTFYAHQYGPRLIKTKIGDILRFLFKEEMVLVEGKDLSATKFGKRVSELYIDPMSAVILRDGLYNRAKKMTDLSVLHLISKTPDLAPRPRPRGGEVDKLGLLAEQRSDEFTYPIPTQFEDPVAYEEFLGELKAAQVLSDWIDERTEDQILETRKVEPGDLLRLVQGSEWLILATQELGRLFGHKDLLAPLEMLKVRLAKGVRPELVKLTTLEGVGRVRARMLYDAGLKSIDDIKERSLEQLMSIRTIGPSLAKRIKEQAGGLIKADEWEKAKKARPSDVEQQVVLTEYEDSE
ncbi:DEAD/DEAH box helicase [Candidatus Bathyarchaeota archaeon]|nr:MAG: DEAD/DEAH box helicase [Candidatus Bathyarchaeota archaeon]